MSCVRLQQWNKLSLAQLFLIDKGTDEVKAGQWMGAQVYSNNHKILVSHCITDTMKINE